MYSIDEIRNIIASGSLSIPTPSSRPIFQTELAYSHTVSPDLSTIETIFGILIKHIKDLEHKQPTEHHEERILLIALLENIILPQAISNDAVTKSEIVKKNRYIRESKEKFNRFVKALAKEIANIFHYKETFNFAFIQVSLYFANSEYKHVFHSELLQYMISPSYMPPSFDIIQKTEDQQIEAIRYYNLHEIMDKEKIAETISKNLLGELKPRALDVFYDEILSGFDDEIINKMIANCLTYYPDKFDALMMKEKVRPEGTIFAIIKIALGLIDSNKSDAAMLKIGSLVKSYGLDFNRLSELTDQYEMQCLIRSLAKNDVKRMIEQLNLIITNSKSSTHDSKSNSTYGPVVKRYKVDSEAAILECLNGRDSFNVPFLLSLATHMPSCEFKKIIDVLYQAKMMSNDILELFTKYYQSDVGLDFLITHDFIDESGCQSAMLIFLKNLNIEDGYPQIEELLAKFFSSNKSFSDEILRDMVCSLNKKLRLPNRWTQKYDQFDLSLNGSIKNILSCVIDKMKKPIVILDYYGSCDQFSCNSEMTKILHFILSKVTDKHKPTQNFINFMLLDIISPTLFKEMLKIIIVNTSTRSEVVSKLEKRLALPDSDGELILRKKHIFMSPPKRSTDERMTMLLDSDDAKMPSTPSFN